MGKDIGWAIQQILGGETVARGEWVTTRRHVYVRLHTPGNGEKLNVPFLYSGDDKGRLAIYEPTASDLLATDWQHYNPGVRAERAAAQPELPLDPLKPRYDQGWQ